MNLLEPAPFRETALEADTAVRDKPRKLPPGPRSHAVPGRKG
jgi:hypothetical protein